MTLPESLRKRAKEVEDAYETALDLEWREWEEGLPRTTSSTAVIENALAACYAEGLERAAKIAFEVEAEYAPCDDSPCCKCPKSHAKADGAAAVAKKIREEAK